MRRNRGWIWLGVFGLIILAPFALRSTYTKPETEGAHYFTRDSDSAHLLINGKRYLISDRDDDGHVDCFQRPGPGTMLGLTAWSVPGTLGCGKMLKREVPAELGPDFDRLLAEQYALGSGPGQPRRPRRRRADRLRRVGVRARAVGLDERGPGGVSRQGPSHANDDRRRTRRLRPHPRHRTRGRATHGLHALSQGQGAGFACSTRALE